MNSFTISSSSSFSPSNVYNQPSRHCSILPNSPSSFEFRRLRLDGESRRSTSLRCNCSSKGTDSGENENKSVLDAFFLGKALAEVINERIESTVGEVLGNLGRIQAEQQKQVQEIQEEVLERAKKAKERAAREAMEAQGLVASRATTNTQKPDSGVVITSVTPTSRVESNAESNENLSTSSGSSVDDAGKGSSSSDEDSVSK